MDAIEELAASIRRIFPDSRLEPVGAERLAGLLRKYPDAPADYVAFLGRIGFGSLGDGDFMIYGGLVGPDDLFDSRTAERLKGVLLLGDDFSGWSIGFDTRAGWRLVGCDHGAVPYPLDEPSLSQFIARRVKDAGSGDASSPGTP